MLHRILDDPAEEVAFRGDALIAIAMIDLEEGKRLASRWSGTPELDFEAKAVLRGSEILERRTYEQALACFASVKLGL